MIDNTTKEKSLEHLKGMVEKINYDLLFIYSALAALDLTRKERREFKMLITETLIEFVDQDYLNEISEMC